MTCSPMCFIIPSTFKAHSNLNRFMSFLLGGREHPPLIILLFLKYLSKILVCFDDKNSDITCKEMASFRFGKNIVKLTIANTYLKFL